MIRSITILLASLSLVGCGKAPLPTSDFTPKPRSTASLTAVETDAALWVSRDPTNRFWATVTPTHSMEPFVNEHSIVLCQRYRGEILPSGAVVLFDRGDTHHVLHVQVDQNTDSVYVSGYNNHDSDGWFPKSSIEGFLVGQLYRQ